MAREVRDRLEACLMRERAALLAGDFAALARLEDEKSALVAAAGALDDRRIRDLADRNNVLLRAAGEGLKAAQARLADLRDAKHGFSTYGADGSRRDAPAPHRTGRKV